MLVKREASGFRRIFHWIEGVDGLVIGADRKEPVAVVRYTDYLRLLVQVKSQRVLNLFD